MIGGTHEAVIKDTDARKLGVQLVKTFKLTAAKGPDLIELIAQTQEKPKEKNPDANKLPAAKPTSVAKKPPTEEKKGDAPVGKKPQAEEKKGDVKPPAALKKLQTSE